MTAPPPADAVDTDELARRWSALHHGIDPHSMPLVGGWLRLMWAGGRLLARAGVPPTAVTVTGAGAALTAVGLAGRRPLPAALVVVTAAVCDGLDGATAVVAQRQSRSGRVADAVADRMADGAFAVVLHRRGAPAWAAGTAAGLAWGVDTLRRVRRVPAKVTVAERPTFTVCATIACVASTVARGRWPAGLSAAVWIGAGAVGVGQLLRTPVGPRP